MCLHRPTGNGKTACFGIGMLSWHDLIGFRIRAMVALQAADLLISVIARIILRQPSNADFNRVHDALFIPLRAYFYSDKILRISRRTGLVDSVHGSTNSPRTGLAHHERNQLNPFVLSLSKDLIGSSLTLLIFKTRSFTNIHEQTCNTSHKTDKQYTGTKA